jgi:hypothetical protein
MCENVILTHQVCRALHPVTIILIFNIVLPYNDIFTSVQSIAYASLLSAYSRPKPQCQPHSAHKAYGPFSTGIKTTVRNVQRCGLQSSPVLRLSNKHEDCIINFRKSSFLVSNVFLTWRLTPAGHSPVFLPQSNVAFINSKNCSCFAVSLLLLALNNFKFELRRIWESFRFLASLFHNYSTRQIGISTFHVSTTKARAGFRWDCARWLRKARITYRYDSSAWA